MSTLQHFNVKIFARVPLAVDLANAIPVFHGWIQGRVCEELLVDVADYRHVPAGPGVVLVGHEANYSLDNAGNRLGLLYNRKAALPGTTAEKLRQAVGAALRACRRLEEAPAFHGQLRFDAGDCEVSVNDRALAPNTEATFLELKPEIDALFTGCWGRSGYTLEHRSDPAKRFSVVVKTPAPVNVSALLENLRLV